VVLYLLSVIDESTGLATPSEMTAIDAFNDTLERDGHWVFAGGLEAPVSAMVLDNRTGELSVTNGPHHEAVEYVSGLWIIEAPDLDAARAIAAEGSRSCNRKVEVRAFLGGRL
jgi:hypothetical protein